MEALVPVLVITALVGIIGAGVSPRGHWLGMTVVSMAAIPGCLLIDWWKTPKITSDYSPWSIDLNALSLIGMIVPVPVALLLGVTFIIGAVAIPVFVIGKVAQCIMRYF